MADFFAKSLRSDGKGRGSPAMSPLSKAQTTPDATSMKAALTPTPRGLQRQQTPSSGDVSIASAMQLTISQRRVPPNMVVSACSVSYDLCPPERQGHQEVPLTGCSAVIPPPTAVASHRRGQAVLLAMTTPTWRRPSPSVATME
jgi:hypothetical protein